MKTTGRELIDALEQVSVLEWYRYSRYEQCVSIPTSATVAWRFDSNRTSNERAAKVVEVIQSVINTAAGIEWCLNYTGRNWVLAPAKVIQLEETGRFGNDGEVNKHIAQHDPMFFTRAHNDLLRISNAFGSLIFDGY